MGHVPIRPSANGTTNKETTMQRLRVGKNWTINVRALSMVSVCAVGWMLAQPAVT